MSSMLFSFLAGAFAAESGTDAAATASKAAETAKQSTEKPAADTTKPDLVLLLATPLDPSADARPLTLLPTGPVPANTSFTVAIRGDNLAAGTFSVWREPDGTCDGKAASARQSIALVASADHRELTGKVGPLPSKADICMAVTYRYALPDGLRDAEVRALAQDVVAGLPRNCDEKAVRDALEAAAKRIQAPENTWRLADSQVAKWLPAYAPVLADRCTARRAKEAALLLQIAPAAAIVPDKALFELMRTNTGAVPTTDGRTLAWKDLPWSYGIADLEKLPAEAEKTLFKDVSPAGKPQLVAQLAAYLVVLDKARKDAAAGPDAADAALKQAEDAMLEVVVDALEGGAVFNTLPTVEGEGGTPDTLASAQQGSYFTPVVGFGAAVPSGGTERDVWAIPYAGANIYFAPIDRDVPLRDIGVPFSSSLWTRRLGLTLGLTLYAPIMDVPGRLDQGLLGGTTTLLVGATYRITRFTNVTAYAVPYRLADDNPLNERGRIEAAYGLAFSFDADIWTAVASLTK